MSPPSSAPVTRPQTTPTGTSAPDGSNAPSAAALSHIASKIFTRGPLLFRLLQRFRPYICPFEELISHVPAGARILDIGCGGGLWLHLLNTTGRLASGLGFDSSTTAINLAQLASPVEPPPPEPIRTQPRLRFIHLDVRAPWPDETFDVVSIIDVLHHVPPAAQRNVIDLACARVRPGGTLIYKDMCRRPRWRALMNRLHDLILARQWIHYAPIDDVEAWAVSAGLQVERRAFFSRWWYGHELRVFVNRGEP